jgi:hypothetical protein
VVYVGYSKQHRYCSTLLPQNNTDTGYCLILEVLRLTWAKTVERLQWNPSQEFSTSSTTGTDLYYLLFDSRYSQAGLISL